MIQLIFPNFHGKHNYKNLTLINKLLFGLIFVDGMEKWETIIKRSEINKTKHTQRERERERERACFSGRRCGIGELSGLRRHESAAGEGGGGVELAA